MRSVTPADAPRQEGPMLLPDTMMIGAAMRTMIGFVLREFG